VRAACTHATLIPQYLSMTSTQDRFASMATKSSIQKFRPGQNVRNYICPFKPNTLKPLPLSRIPHWRSCLQSVVSIRGSNRAAYLTYHLVTRRFQPINALLRRELPKLQVALGLANGRQRFSLPDKSSGTNPVLWIPDLRTHQCPSRV